MSQEKPRRPEKEPIKYGDVFNVSGDLSSQPIAPRDAAAMQSAEDKTLGQTLKDGPASLMTSAAQKNEDAGFIGHNTATNIARNEGVAVSETCDSGKRVITETLGGQVLGKFVEDANASKGSTFEDEGDPNPLSAQAPKVGVAMDRDFISNQGGGVMNPLLNGNQNENKNAWSNDGNQNENKNAWSNDGNQNENKNAWSNDSMGKGVRNENPETISSVPGGMGASMATAAADRLKKNK